jgi:hypothetical protein
MHNNTTQSQQQQSTLQGSSLIKAAFFDAPLLVASVSVVRDFVAMGDARRGLSFLRYK